MSCKVMAAILAHREVAPLLSDGHFLVDGTLVKAWASIKSFQPKVDGMPSDGNDPGNPPGPDTPAKDLPEQAQADASPQLSEPQRRSQFPGRDRLQHHSRLEDRPGGAALPAPLLRRTSSSMR